MKFLSSLINTCVNFLFPKNQKILHLETLSPSKLLEILPHQTSLDESDVIALFDYTHPLVREIIWGIKYTGNRNLADKLGAILFDTIQDELMERSMFDSVRWQKGRPLLIPMPVSDKRRLERGWNQAELLAEAIRKYDTNQRLKYLQGQLVKYRHTESQTQTSSKSERLKNLKDSMRVLNPESISSRCVILVDDVTTTGSTFVEAKRALKTAGAKRILCLAIAH
ncbi:MAG: phosphoribosyltransferase family protein [bacterium]